jgi:uncharacterized protein YcbX
MIDRSRGVRFDMKVFSLHRYPIKGCRGERLERADFDRYGIEDDRRLMLVDSADRFVSQRELPVLATISPLLRDGVLQVRAENRTPFDHRVLSDGPTRSVMLWQDSIVAVDQGDHAAAWFSAAVGQSLRLVAWGSPSVRLIDPEFSPRSDAEATFVDGYPALITLRASLEDLNRRLTEPVPMDRFRPSIVVAGGEAWQEDAWGELRIGAMTFDAVKPCARCAVPTTDQHTGARHPRQEPLRTLAGFRTLPGRGVIFGQNLVHRAPGGLAVGDRIDVG